MEDPNFIFGCGQSCIFKFSGVGGSATDGGCHCVEKNMTQEELMSLRKKIRELVNYASVLRATVNSYRATRSLKEEK